MARFMTMTDLSYDGFNEGSQLGSLRGLVTKADKFGALLLP